MVPPPVVPPALFKFVRLFVSKFSDKHGAALVVTGPPVEYELA